MQTVFLKAVTKIHTLKDPNRLRPWLLSITRRACIDYYRRRKPTVPLDQAGPLSAAPNDPPDRFARLHAALSQLPPKYCETLCLYYIDGHHCASVAQSLGISDQAVRRRLVRARLMLHDLLTEDPI